MAEAAPSSLVFLNRGVDKAIDQLVAYSTSSFTPTAGSKVFTVASHGVIVGEEVKAQSAGSSASMQGLVTAVTLTQITINVTAATGSGAHTDWVLTSVSGGYREGFTLGWTNNGTGSTYFEVECDASTGSFVLMGTTAPGVTTFLATNIPIKPSTGIINFRVRANGPGGPSAYITEGINMTGGTLNPLPPVSGDLPAPSVALAAAGPYAVIATITPFGLMPPAARVLTNWRITLTRAGGFAPVEYDVHWSRLTPTISGLVPGQDYTATARQIHLGAAGVVVGDGSAPDGATTDGISPAIAGPSTVTARNSTRVVGTFLFEGSGSVDSISIDGPAGLTIARRGVTDYYDLGGTVTTPGRYDCTISVTAIDGAAAMVEHTHQFVLIVSGGSFLADLHADPLALDLQVDIRAETVASYAPGILADGLRVIRGDAAAFVLILRDGARICTELTISAARLIIRPTDQYNADPYYFAKWDGATTRIVAGFAWPVLTLGVGQAAGDLDALFAQLNQTSTANPGARSLAGRGEITITLSTGKVITPDIFPALIVQDSNR